MHPPDETHLNKVEKVGGLCNWVGANATRVAIEQHFLWRLVNHVEELLEADGCIALQTDRQCLCRRRRRRRRVRANGQASGSAFSWRGCSVSVSLSVWPVAAVFVWRPFRLAVFGEFAEAT